MIWYALGMIVADACAHFGGYVPGTADFAIDFAILGLALVMRRAA